MRKLVIVALLAVGFMTGRAEAQSPAIQQQVQELQAQVAVLSEDLTRLKTLLAAQPDGGVVLGAPANLDLRVLGRHRLNVSRDSLTTVGGNQSTTIGGTTRATFGQSLSEDVGGQYILRVGQSLSEDVGGQYILRVRSDRNERTDGDYGVEVGRKLLLQAGDGIILRAGKALMEMKSSGDITISGRNIRIEGSGNINVKASGDTVIKGSRILQN
jgi:hypothetical protein